MNAAKQKRTRRNWLTFRRRVGLIVVGLVIGALSLVFANNMARQLRQKEHTEIRLWAYFNSNIYDTRNPVIRQVIDTGIDIPYIITDGTRNVRSTNVIEEGAPLNSGQMRKTIDRFAAQGNSFSIPNPYGGVDWVFYGESRLLRMFTWFPFIQLTVIVIFAVFGYIMEHKGCGRKGCGLVSGVILQTA